MPLNLSQVLWKQIKAQAEAGYPSECCGLGLSSRQDPDTISEIFPCRNVQDEFHRLDPQVYPRTSRTAYIIDPKALLVVHRKVQEESLLIRLIYHSHMDAPADFSEEDKRLALQDGNPVYPSASYLIVPVHYQKAAEPLLYTWDPSQKAFCPDKPAINQ